MAITNFGAIDSAWKSVCKVLFGREIGGLAEYEPYLKEVMLPIANAKSYISGKDVFLSHKLYGKDARFASLDEIKNANSEPFSINDIKDADSLFRAASERLVFCGNKTFGRNFNVGSVDSAIDCSDVYCSTSVRNVKKSAFASCMREAEYVFGTPAYPKLRYAVRCVEGINLVRGFETHYSTNVSDMYYSMNCSNCSDAIFAFNLRGKRHIIGNIELPVEKYATLKAKLVSEMADDLERNRRTFSLVDIALMGAPKGIREQEVAVPPLPPPRQIEEAFTKTTSLLFGKGHKGISAFSPWLKSRAMQVKKIKGRFGTPTYKPDLPIVKDLPPSFLCTLDEALGKGGKPIVSEDDLSLPIRELAKKASKNAFSTLEFVDGRCENCPDVSAVFDSTNVYSMWDATNSNLSACTSAAIQSQYVFGGFLRILDSQFCINCYEPVGLKMCFEVDSSSNCSKCYFCHNIEGCEDCMFCFNAKGLHYAIFNKEVGKEEYMRLKAMLLEHLNSRLDSAKAVRESIFSLCPPE